MVATLGSTMSQKDELLLRAVVALERIASLLEEQERCAARSDDGSNPEKRCAREVGHRDKQGRPDQHMNQHGETWYE